MLFNSYTFIFAFLPVALAGFHLASRFGRRPAAAWLILTSFVFYGWWSPTFVLLLIASTLFNYGASEAVAAFESRPRLRTTCLCLAITVNLLVLCYYKYLTTVLHALTNLGLLDGPVSAIVLPLGISFFTFTQIGYLIDRNQGLVKESGFLNYLLFVTFFPHLIAGPILHHREIMPQFADGRSYRFSYENIAAGMTIFIMGLVKKCLLADPLSATVIAGLGNIHHLSMLSAWNVALSYSLQLYFDFSGYSDMAIGLARMFNIHFPLNFNSPYKAASIIDHWQRWHMTLSRYLRLYLYNPISLAVTRWRVAHGLGITRNAQATFGGFVTMMLVPTLITMLLAGIWHGAGLQFVIFGLLHGTYLTINHAFRIFRSGKPRPAHLQPVMLRCSNILLTYLAALVASIFFRAASVGSGFSLLGGMIGLHGAGSIALPMVLLAKLGGMGQSLMGSGFVSVVSILDWTAGVAHFGWLIVLYAIVWGMPNTQQIMRNYIEPSLGRVTAGPLPQFAWRPNRGWAVVVGALTSIGILAIGGTTEFLYFQF
jgi:D-alanyl-lipoteichoic acid acyltransferase DltB (MBOAT superfamily)